MKTPSITSGTITTKRVTTYTNTFDRQAFFSNVFKRYESHPHERAVINHLISVEVSYGAIGLMSPLARGMLSTL